MLSSKGSMCLLNIKGVDHRFKGGNCKKLQLVFILLLILFHYYFFIRIIWMGHIATINRYINIYI